MQARLGEGFFLVLLLNLIKKSIIYSIRLVPGSSPGQPIIINISKLYVHTIVKISIEYRKLPFFLNESNQVKKNESNQVKKSEFG